MYIWFAHVFGAGRANSKETWMQSRNLLPTFLSLKKPVPHFAGFPPNCQFLVRRLSPWQSVHV